MGISSHSSTLLNQYIPPFKTQGDFAANQILIYDPVCKAFVNASPSVLASLIAAGTNTVVESIQLYSTVAVGDSAAYVLPWPAISAASLIVTLDGVKQITTSYSITVHTDVTVLTFAENIPVGVEIEVQGFQVAVPRRVLRHAETAAGALTELEIPWVVNTEKAALVFLDGVKQHQGSYEFTYSASGTTTITFSETVPDGTVIEAIGLYGFDPNSFKFNQFTGNGILTTFALNWAVDSEAALFVSIDGVKQQNTAYSFTNTSDVSADLVFTAPVPNLAEIEITGFTAFDNLGTMDDIFLVGNNLGTGHAVWNSIVQLGDQTQINFRTLEAGTGISLSSSPSVITISSDADAFTFANIGTGVELLKEPITTDLEFRSLIAGDGIVLTQGANDITIDVDVADLGIDPTTFATTLNSAGSGVDLVKKSSASPDGIVQLYSLKAGSGIVVHRVGNHVIIADANGGNYSKVVSNYTVELDDSIVGVNDTSIQRFITLTSVALAGPGKTVVIKDETGLAATNNIIVSAPGGSTVDGVASVSITQNYGSQAFYCDGSNWFTI